MQDSEYNLLQVIFRKLSKRVLPEEKGYPPWLVGSYTDQVKMQILLLKSLNRSDFNTIFILSLYLNIHAAEILLTQ
jgi:hypothetical protein